MMKMGMREKNEGVVDEFKSQHRHDRASYRRHRRHHRRRRRLLPAIINISKCL